MKSEKKTNRLKIPVYFNKVTEAPKLAMLEHFRILSQTDLTLPQFIKFLALEYCLLIDRAERDELEQEKKDEGLQDDAWYTDRYMYD